MSAGWIETYTGARVDVFNIDPRTLRMEDIACGLSNCCRFAGQLPEHYSVAQHSVLMSHLVPESYAREALMHDASEAYLGDVPAPIKRGLSDYRAVETYVQEMIAKAFGLVFPCPDAIHEADKRMVLTEGHHFGRNIGDWQIDALPYSAAELTIVTWSPEQAWRIFMTTADRLGVANLYTETP
jgi:hypothetical protein